ncbi:MAG: TetR/AcrR family transcriptional regulator [Hyphomicrobiaceae bacterium]|nr:TetR/AcrR family transcriptional regulator [Hyphomicrobiaceae bacterium]
MAGGSGGRTARGTETRSRPRAGRKAAARREYHHGDLRRTLVVAALALANEVGPENVSVREAARRAGVSPGAPFRHFPDRTALMTAVAEEAMARLRSAVERDVADDGPPLPRLEALGRAYLRWVLENPMHFEIISRRTGINFEGSAQLVADNMAIQARMRAIFLDAASEGTLRVTDLRTAEIMARAFVYGLARMHVDGHFPSWGVPPAEVEAVMERTIAQFIALLTCPPRPK